MVWSLLVCKKQLIRAKMVEGKFFYFHNVVEILFFNFLFRCPVCGRVYQWKLLNHVSRDHSMSLKPAHLSYKCTVCTATFGMYKQFENHVYSAHSNVAKNSNKKTVTNQPVASSSSSSSTSITSTPKVYNLNYYLVTNYQYH